MKKVLSIIIVFFTIMSNVIAQNTFATGSGTISFSGELVYSAYQHDINGGNVWVQGYSAIEGDSIFYTMVVYSADKSNAYYCTQRSTCQRDVYVLEDSVETLNDPTFPTKVHLFTLSGKAENNKRMKSIYCREYSRENWGLVRRYEEYSLLLSFDDKKRADLFYKQLVDRAGRKEKKE